MNNLSLIKTILLLCFFALDTNINAQNQIDDPSSINPIQTQQRGTNIISCSAYDAIKYKGHTINQINNTQGIISGVHQLWGRSDSVSEMSGVRKRVFLYGNNRVSFNYEHGYLAGMGIKESNWPITVLGKEIRVGNSFSELMQKFGDDLRIIYKSAISSRYAVSFGCNENDYDGLLIYFQPTTHEVEEIRYFVNS
ncbi:hypothetical protein [Gracilimonas sp.]|uniref:hypothetical protein n=1 Tax=Gracilimonas sp. TaxID=1974203 RepID=UPI0032ECE152